VVAGPVFEVDDDPVEASGGGNLRGHPGAEVEPGAGQEFTVEDAVAEVVHEAITFKQQLQSDFGTMWEASCPCGEDARGLLVFGGA